MSGKSVFEKIQQASLAQEEKKKPAIKAQTAYKKAPPRSVFFKLVFAVLALGFVGMLLSLSRSNQPISKIVHMPHMPHMPHIPEHCIDPSTSLPVKCAPGMIVGGLSESELLLMHQKQELQREQERQKWQQEHEQQEQEEEKQQQQQQEEQQKQQQEQQQLPQDGLSKLERSHKPTREMVQQLQQDGYLVVTWANWHYQDFVRTWVARVKESGVHGYIVGAMDDRLMQALIETNINTFSMRSGLTESDFGWGTPTFARMGREKIKLIRIFLELDVNVIISDVDVLWLRNPINYFERYKTADILSSSDLLTNTVDGEELEVWPRAAAAANIGIMLFRKNSLELVNEWIDIIEKDAKVWDQNAFNDLFRRGLQVIPNEPQHLFKGYHGKLLMGILPVSVFGSGHTFFTQRMFQKLNLEPYALHATFQFAGTPGKRHRMREFKLFDDPPEYYDHPVGFITYSVDGLDELLQNAGPATGRMDLENVQGHFKLVNHQLQRLRNALAITQTLGRAVVIPQFYCGLDRWWAPHAGRIPGSNFALPFPCPLDHVLELDSPMTRPQVDEHHFGKPTDFREYSFFQNPKMTDGVRDNKVIVEICPQGQSGCSDGSTPAPLEDGRIKVQGGLLSEQLRNALKNAEGFKVMEFTTMADAFKGFSNADDWRKFSNRMRVYTSLWCCVLAHPGHIHYDMLWDIPGHVDKFGRKWEGEWVTKTGP